MQTLTQFIIEDIFYTNISYDDMVLNVTKSFSVSSTRSVGVYDNSNHTHLPSPYERVIFNIDGIGSFTPSNLSNQKVPHDYYDFTIGNLVSTQILLNNTDTQNIQNVRLGRTVILQQYDNCIIYYEIDNFYSQITSGTDGYNYQVKATCIPLKFKEKTNCCLLALCEPTKYKLK